MGRKPIKVYLPKEVHDYLKVLCSELGLSESEVMKISLLDYMKDLGFLRVKYKKVVFAKPEILTVTPKR